MDSWHLLSGKIFRIYMIAGKGSCLIKGLPPHVILKHTKKVIWIDVTITLLLLLGCIVVSFGSLVSCLPALSISKLLIIVANMFKLFIMDGGSFWSAWPMSLALLRTILDMVSGLPTCRTLYWISILYIVNCVPWSNIQVPHCIETNGYRFLNNVIYRHYKSF